MNDAWAPDLALRWKASSLLSSPGPAVFIKHVLIECFQGVGNTLATQCCTVRYAVSRSLLGLAAWDFQGGLFELNSRNTFCGKGHSHCLLRRPQCKLFKKFHCSNTQAPIPVLLCTVVRGLMVFLSEKAPVAVLMWRDPRKQTPHSHR